MSLDGFSVHALASGSTANSCLVTGGGRALILDAGVGMRQLKKYCDERGVPPESIDGVLVSHEHTDHARGAIPFCVRYKVPLIASEGTIAALVAQDGREPPHRILAPSDEIGVGPFTVRGLPITHDAAEPTGFRVEASGHALVYATDTGSITPELRDACIGCSLLVIEANHDIHKLRFGPYSDALKARILARTGHLSNNAAVDLVLSHTDNHGPIALWFAHLSEVNNTPGTVLSYWKRRWRAEGLRASPAAAEIAGRDTPSLVYRPGSRAIQKSLW